MYKVLTTVLSDKLDGRKALKSYFDEGNDISIFLVVFGDGLEKHMPGLERKIVGPLKVIYKRPKIREKQGHLLYISLLIVSVFDD